MLELPQVLMLDISGTPRDWIDYKKSAYYYSKGLVAWDMGATDFTLHGGISRMTFEPVTMSINTIIAIKGKISTKQNANFNKVRLLNKILFRRDMNICAYCGLHFKNADLTRDHIHPVSRGGKDIWTNVVTSCKSCNRAKDYHTLDECKMELLYVPYAPSKYEALILRNRDILADQMQFLMAGVSKESRLLDPRFSAIQTQYGLRLQ